MDKRQPTDAAHEAIRERLPWYASGTLEGAERAAIAAHLERCAACRAELELERRSAALFRASAPAPRSPEPGLSRLLAQIDGAPSAPQSACPGTTNPVPTPVSAVLPMRATSAATTGSSAVAARRARSPSWPTIRTA